MACGFCANQHAKKKTTISKNGCLCYAKKKRFIEF
jgi:hypothetical protein